MVFVYQLSIIYLILDLIYWMVTIFIFDANHQLLLQSRVSENLMNPRSFISVVNDLKTLFYCWFNLHDTLFTKWSVMNRRNKVTQIKVLYRIGLHSLSPFWLLVADKLNWVSLTLFFCLLNAVFHFHVYDSVAIVRAQSGQVFGKIETLPLSKLRHAYLGIPYAEPPVGESRFAAPKPAKRLSGIRNTTEYGATCLQPDYRLPHVKISVQGT